jgi:hypothetical protein
MATIYKIKIKTVSAFSSYPAMDVERIIKKLIDEYKNPETGLGFESTTIHVSKE